MAVSDTARKNHDELFPGHVSTLAVTDPELIEVFDFDFIHATNDVLTERGIELPLPGQSATRRSPPSAGATPRWAGMSQPTSTSATPART